MSLPSFRGSSTSYQRLYIRTLMRDLALPTDHLTLQHRRVFEKAQLDVDAQAGRPVDDVLTELSRAQACALIDTLKTVYAGGKAP